MRMMQQKEQDGGIINGSNRVKELALLACHEEGLSLVR